MAHVYDRHDAVNVSAELRGQIQHLGCHLGACRGEVIFQIDARLHPKRSVCGDYSIIALRWLPGISRRLRCLLDVALGMHLLVTMYPSYPDLWRHLFGPAHSCPCGSWCWRSSRRAMPFPDNFQLVPQASASSVCQCWCCRPMHRGRHVNELLPHHGEGLAHHVLCLRVGGHALELGLCVLWCRQPQSPPIHQRRGVPQRGDAQAA
mmetsp:Transcript_49869/g.117310  ORF Transcript_49869/g.117310 Transcript_49869/m.117310 type:complete len:206 (+) Transcript_49869:453-1070(+)